MTSKHSNGARAPDSSFAMAAFAPVNAANSLLISQRVALEAARFWARRMRAYADQWEALAACSTADDLAGAQTRFIDRLREDYATESQVMTALMAPQEPERQGVRSVA